jgi:hypothetical protein
VGAPVYPAHVPPRSLRVIVAKLLWAAVLWGGECSAISHRAAAALYRLDGCEPGPVELTVDFAYPELRVAIELDGLAKRTSRQAVDRELARQNAMVLDGWRVLRFTWSDVTERPGRVVDCVLRAVAA